MSTVSGDYFHASEACVYYGGRLAVIDECNLLGEVAKYIVDNGECTRKSGLCLSDPGQNMRI